MGGLHQWLVQKLSLRLGGLGRRRRQNATACSSATASSSATCAPFRLEDFAGIATFRGKPIYNPQQVINQIDGGADQPAATARSPSPSSTARPRSAWYNSPKYQALGVTEGFGYSEFSAAEKAVAREAMILWDDLIPQKIVEKNGNGADIVFANTTTGPAQAHAYYPGNGPKIQGDVWTAEPERQLDQRLAAI